MNYMIKGGEFNNKGAEAMTLTALFNIRKHDPLGTIYIIQSGTNCPFEFYCESCAVSLPAYFIDRELGKNANTVRKYLIKDLIKMGVPGKHSFIGRNREIRQIFRQIDVFIDISGFALSSKWGKEKALEYLNWIQLMKRNGSKVYLMPQSFGPFYFERQMIDTIRHTLNLCDHIFAREDSGYEALLSMGLENVSKCNDSVLIDKEYDPSSVIRHFDSYIEDVPVRYKYNIGIVPNARLFDKGDVNEATLLSFYEDIIKEHCNENYGYYLISHAGEDMRICKEIKRKFSRAKNVILMDHVLYSFNFERLASKLDYIVASRYHSIVHAYKAGTPCAIIGWSDKYKEIAKVFDQEKYIIDANALRLETLTELDKNYRSESILIKERLNFVQECSCYSVLFN